VCIGAFVATAQHSAFLGAWYLNPGILPKLRFMAKLLLANLALWLCTSVVFAQNAAVTIIDTRHYSSVLGEIRNYLIFLPPVYHQHP
jgi:hypothetical protein